MKLVILGSGTAVPHAQRASAAHWLTVQDFSLLLDPSASFMLRAAQEGLDWAALDAIWISHFHLDHIGGLAPFLFGTKFAPQTQARRQPLVIYGPQGTARLLHAFDDANRYRLLEQPFPVEIREVDAGAEFPLGPHLHAATCDTPHTPESLALRLQDAGGASVAYTSDMGYSADVAEFARGTDVLLTECSFRVKPPRSKHLDLADAVRLARVAGPRCLVLAHLYPQWDGADIATEAAKLWDGKTIAAFDGLRLAIAGEKTAQIC